MNVFFCDLRGTFDGSIDNREKDIHNFIVALNQLAKNLEINDLVFRFITSDNIDFLMPFINEMIVNTQNSVIRLTSQFADNIRFKNGEIEILPYHNKVDQMCYISRNKNIEKFFYADDNYINQLLAKKAIEHICPNVEFISFIPGFSGDLEDNMYSSDKKGIVGLTNIIENYNKSLKKEKLFYK